MYSIYTTLLGIKVNDDLACRMMETEFTEAFYDFDEAPGGFICEVPYSGDGTPSIHLGVVLGATSPGSSAPPRQPSEEDREKFEAGRKWALDALEQTMASWQNSDCWNDDVAGVYEDFSKVLASAEPEVYVAYSTS